jgi:hypothetical protein
LVKILHLLLLGILIIVLLLRVLLLVNVKLLLRVLLLLHVLLRLVVAGVKLWELMLLVELSSRELRWVALERLRFRLVLEPLHFGLGLKIFKSRSMSLHIELLGIQIHIDLAHRLRNKFFGFHIHLIF